MSARGDRCVASQLKLRTKHCVIGFLICVSTRGTNRRVIFHDESHEPMCHVHCIMPLCCLVIQCFKSWNWKASRDEGVMEQNDTR